MRDRRHGVLIAPLQPGINDSPEQVARIIEPRRRAAVDIGGIALHLRGEVRELWFDWLRNHRPELLPRYERLYAYATKAERERLSALARPKHLPNRHAGAAFRRAARGGRSDATPGPPAPPLQESLF